MTAQVEIDKATDRFYEQSTIEGDYETRGFLADRLRQALARHGIACPSGFDAECIERPFTACKDVYRLGVTAIEIVAACALAEQDYLRSKGND